MPRSRGDRQRHPAPRDTDSDVDTEAALETTALVLQEEKWLKLQAVLKNLSTIDADDGRSIEADDFGIALELCQIDADAAPVRSLTQRCSADGRVDFQQFLDLSRGPEPEPEPEPDIEPARPRARTGPRPPDQPSPRTSCSQNNSTTRGSDTRAPGRPPKLPGRSARARAQLSAGAELVHTASARERAATAGLAAEAVSLQRQKIADAREVVRGELRASRWPRGGSDSESATSAASETDSDSSAEFNLRRRSRGTGTRKKASPKPPPLSRAGPRVPQHWGARDSSGSDSESSGSESSGSDSSAGESGEDLVRGVSTEVSKSQQCQECERQLPQGAPGKVHTDGLWYCASCWKIADAMAFDKGANRRGGSGKHAPYIKRMPEGQTIQPDQWVSSTPGRPVRRVAQVKQQTEPARGSIGTEQTRHRAAALLQSAQQERKACRDAQLQVVQQQEAEACVQAEVDELVHDFSVMEPAPASVECAPGASGDPFAADREFFNMPRADASLAPGLQAPGASVLNQGRSGTCTRYGLAAAITDNINAHIESLPRDKRRHVADAALDASSQKGVVNALQQHRADAGGAHPDAFHDKQIKVEDTRGRWYRVHISVSKNRTMNDQAMNGQDTLDLSRESKTHVICYNTDTTGHKRHCVYLERCDLDGRKWIGLNSWGNTQPAPQISMHSNVAIYDVKVTSFVLLKGSGGLTENVVLWGEDRDQAAEREQTLQREIDAVKLAREAEREIRELEGQLQTQRAMELAFRLRRFGNTQRMSLAEIMMTGGVAAVEALNAWEDSRRHAKQERERVERQAAKERDRIRDVEEQQRQAAREVAAQEKKRQQAAAEESKRQQDRQDALDTERRKFEAEKATLAAEAKKTHERGGSLWFELSGPGGCVELSAGQQEATRTAKDVNTWRAAATDVLGRSGAPRTADFTIIEGAYSCFGLMPADADINNIDPPYDMEGACLYYNMNGMRWGGGCVGEGVQEWEGMQKAGVGDTLTLVHEPGPGSLTVWKNGARLGLIETSGLKGSYRWVVAMQTVGHCVRIAARRNPALRIGYDLSIVNRNGWNKINATTGQVIAYPDGATFYDDDGVAMYSCY